MILFLDTNVVIYVVEGNPAFAPMALRRLAAAQLAAERLASGPRNISKPMDSLQLAAAVEHGSNLFLTGDARLGSFTDLTVEVLR